MKRYRGKHSEQSEHQSQHTPAKKSRRPLTKKQKWLIAVCIALAVALAGVIAWKLIFVKPELHTPMPADSAEETDYGDGIRPRADGERKSKDYYTVLILGRDTGGGGNTDTMLLASYDVTNQKATVMSIPRDTMVNVSWDIKRINSVYNYYGGDKKGINALYREISQLVGFEPDYQVVVEWEAVGEIVDAMGGVYFDVPRNMNYDDPIQDLHIHQEKGYRLLSGDDAMQVIRWRHDNNMSYGYADGDLGRIKTQQSFLKAVVKQLLQLKNITKINQFAKVFQNNVETDLSFSNLCWFGQQAVLGGLSVDDVKFITMPNTPTSCWSRVYHNYQSYVTPNANELLELVNNELSPFVEKFSLSDLDIMSVNRDGSVSSSAGHVEDSKAAVAPSIPAHTDTTPVENEEPSAEGEAGDSSGETGAETGGATGETTGGETGGGETGEITGGETAPETGETVGGETGGTAADNGQDTGEGTGGITAPAEPSVPAEPADGTITNAAA